MLAKLTAVLVGLLLTVGVGASASAYAPESPGGTVTVGPGGTVTVPFGGFAPGGPVTFFLSGENASSATLASGFSASGLGTGVVVVRPVADSATFSRTADSAGNVSASVTIDEPGSYVLTATGTGADGNPRSVSTAIEVVAPGADTAVVAGSAGSTGSVGSAGAPALARTGLDNVAATAWVAVGLALMGGLFVAFGRRRPVDQA